jgi:hypothetical protein
VATAVAAVLALAGPARGGGPTMMVGVVDDSVKKPTFVAAKARMDLIRLAGFDTVRITTIWSPGQTKPEALEQTLLRNAITAARLSGLKVTLSVAHQGSRTTPLTEEARTELVAYTTWLARRFTSVREFVIGNEPNLNRFWLPQFDEDGGNAAAPAYLQLLTASYDALKEVSPSIRVWGGALAPRGIDRPNSGRDTHSPTAFIRDLGTAYRDSGRAEPIMDGLAIHPYGDTSQQAPIRSRHSNSTIGLADYAKLVRLLGNAFDGTGQLGSTLPILYDEYGVESQIPAGRTRLYTGTEPTTTRPVSEPTQALYYRQAMQLSFCAPTVAGLMLFHIADEPARLGWQSGLAYANGVPKSSYKPVALAVRDTKGGVVSRCRGLALTPKVSAVRWPSGVALTVKKPLSFRLTCSLDCAYAARLELVRAAKPKPVAGEPTDGQPPAAKPKAKAAKPKPLVVLLSGTVLAKTPSYVRLRLPKGAPAGLYRLRVSLTAAVNKGKTIALKSPSLRLRG